MEPLKEKKLETPYQPDWIWIMHPSEFTFLPRCSAGMKYDDEAFLLQLKHLKDRARCGKQILQRFRSPFQKNIEGST